MLDGGSDVLNSEKVRALRSNVEVSGSRVVVVWMEDGGGIMSEELVRWFWMVELSLEEISMKSVRGIFFERFWVEELALEAIEEYGQKCSCLRDNFPHFDEELEKENQMTRCQEELKESGEKHSIGKCNIGSFGHTYHTVGNVVGEVEGFSNGEAIEHVERRDGPIGSERTNSLTRNFKNASELLKKLKHKDETNLFVYIKKTIKPNSRESRTEVGLIIKKGGVDGATLMEDTRNKRFVDLSFMSGKTSGSMKHGNVVSSIMVINVDGFWQVHLMKEKKDKNGVRFVDGFE
uniref:Uncharacterized protein n=1 Tax=Tanacetum cinerariifolium TaxID=118510 RepID=A0A6L2P8N3_TANCI|nr:hypothetical protein [Tanacetum cinerariifolium]